MLRFQWQNKRQRPRYNPSCSSFSPGKSPFKVLIPEIRRSVAKSAQHSSCCAQKGRMQHFAVTSHYSLEKRAGSLYRRLFETREKTCRVALLEEGPAHNYKGEHHEKICSSCHCNSLYRRPLRLFRPGSPLPCRLTVLQLLLVKRAQATDSRKSLSRAA
jgi:hypothetical protein